MPYKFNEPRRHKIPRARYRVQNWPEYDRALQRRGDLTVWVTPEGDRGLVPAAHGAARSAAGLLGRGDRDRAPAAPGLWPAVAADRGPAALPHRLARPGVGRPRPYHVLAAQPGLGAGQVAGTSAGGWRAGARGD